jgi:hypothetical protein
MRANPRDQASTVYTLLDAGEATGETTHATIEDFIEPDAPRFVMAPGNGHLASRFLPLDPWARHVLMRHLDHARRARHPLNAPLTYKGWKHQPGSQSATVSAHQVTERFIAPLGLLQGDLTVGSITQWRVATTLKTHGSAAALELSGRIDEAAMYRALGERIDAGSPDRPDDSGTSFAA